MTSRLSLIRMHTPYMRNEEVQCECEEEFPVLSFHHDPRVDWAQHLDKILEANRE